MGPVFRAYEPDRDRLVAVKVFRLDLPPERVHQLVAEFERLISATLAHPAIAAPLASGIDGAVAYLAQDYVAAESLDILIRDGGPTLPADALRVAIQLAGSLDFAALVNVHHGALHPRDVLISQDQARMTGLGVPRALEQVGTAPPVRRPYTAPERMAGGAWDHRADIFSLAAVIHEVLWGRRVSGTGAQVAHTLTDLAGGDLAALRRVFGRALADEPADRYDTALIFAEALKEAFPGTVVAAARPTRPALVVEPLLPLDEPAPLPDLSDVRALPDLPDLAGPPEPDGLLADMELAPALVLAPAVEPRAVDPSPLEDEPISAPLPLRLMEPYSSVAPVSIPERHSAATWPLALALLVGLALGFAGGYAVGNFDQPIPTVAAGPAQPAAPVASTVPTGREWMEGEVPPKPIPIPAAKTERSAPPVAAAGRLLVRSTPSGARVFVDGADRGPTPVALRGLTHGAHRLRVVREGYAPEDRRVVITAGRSAQSVTIALARPVEPRAAQPAVSPAAAPAALGRFGAMTVESRPRGAKVFIDDQLVGTTPLKLSSVSAGEHVVRLELEGYRRWTTSVRVDGSGQNRVAASLESR